MWISSNSSDRYMQMMEHSCSPAGTTWSMGWVSCTSTSNGLASWCICRLNSLTCKRLWDYSWGEKIIFVPCCGIRMFRFDFFSDYKTKQQNEAVTYCKLPQALPPSLCVIPMWYTYYTSAQATFTNYITHVPPTMANCNIKNNNKNATRTYSKNNNKKLFLLHLWSIDQHLLENHQTTAIYEQLS